MPAPCPLRCTFPWPVPHMLLCCISPPAHGVPSLCPLKRVFFHRSVSRITSIPSSPGSPLPHPPPPPPLASFPFFSCFFKGASIDVGRYSPVPPSPPIFNKVLSPCCFYTPPMGGPFGLFFFSSFNLSLVYVTVKARRSDTKEPSFRLKPPSGPSAVSWGRWSLDAKLVLYSPSLPARFLCVNWDFRVFITVFLFLKEETSFFLPAEVSQATNHWSFPFSFLLRRGVFEICNSVCDEAWTSALLC